MKILSSPFYISLFSFLPVLFSWLMGVGEGEKESQPDTFPPCPTVISSLTNNQGLICQGESDTINFVFEGSEWPLQVFYNDGTNFITILDIASPFSLTVSPTTTTTWTVDSIWYGFNGCSEVFAGLSTTVFVNDPPLITLSPNIQVCEGDSLKLSVESNPPGMDYTWEGPNNFNSTGQNPIIPNSTAIHSGCYNVTVTDIAGCSAMAETCVTVEPIPAVMFGSNSPVCDGDTLFLFENGGAANTWEWSGPNGFSSVEQNPFVPDVTDSEAGDYSVTVSDNGSCTATDVIEVEVAACGCDRQSDSLALVELYNATDGGNWTYDSDSHPTFVYPVFVPQIILNAGNPWDFSQPINTWHGVGVNASGCVEILALFNNGLMGELTNLNLPDLQLFSCGANKLSGSVPDFQNLENLTGLSCFDNNLSGSIPDFQNLPSLRWLHCSYNNFSGNIPDFQNLANLREFVCDNNSLSGSIPDFTNLPSLQLFYCYHNDFTDSLPNLNDNCPILSRFYHDWNAFTFENILPSINENNVVITQNALYNSDSLRYNPQDSIFTDTTFTRTVGDNLTIDLLIDENIADNKYLWYKNGQPYDTIIGNNDLVFSNIQASDAGTYLVHVTNPGAPDLTLESYPITIQVSGGVSSDIVITEIMYNPPEAGLDSLEFIEIYNKGNGPIGLSGWTIQEAIDFQFPDITIESQQALLIAKDSSAIFNVFGQQSIEWTDNLSTLNNAGETILLVDDLGGTVDSVPYLDSWLPLSDGQGASLSLCEIGGDNSMGQAWGVANTLSNILINGIQVLANPGEVANCALNDCRYLDSLGLVALYDATNGNNWTNKTNWKVPGQTIDTWYGIELNANGCVSCIDLDGIEDCDAGVSGGGNNLAGVLPDLAFSELQLLSLHDNNLAGPIPQLTMPNLLSLGMGHCQLTGTIPVFNFPELQFLALCCNGLTGDIPAINSPNLVGLYLQENQLSGNLPLQLADLANLEVLRLGDNDLTGSLPVSWINLTNLTWFELGNNQLEGCFPSSYDVFCNISYWFTGNPGLPGGGDFAAFCANGTGACAGCDLSAYITVNNTSCGQPNGTATAVISNGTGNYTYLWSTGATTQTITDLDMGTYSVTITDGNCQSVVSGIVGFVEEPVIEWERNYGGGGSDVATSIQETSDKGFVIVGGSWSNDGDVGSNKGESDTWIIKINQDGDLEWEKSFGGTDRDYAESIQHTKDGGFIVANATMSNDGDVSLNKGGFDYWIFKLDQGGNLSWEKTYGGSGSDEIYSIKETQDGGYILGGHTISSDGDVGGNNGGFDYWVVKLNQNAAIEWEQNFGGTDTEFMFSIEQTLDGGYVAAGWSESSDNDVGGNFGMRDYWIVKMNAIGTIEWERNFGGTSTDGPDADNAIQITKDGGFIIAGGSRSNDGDVTENNGAFDYWVIKLNDNGILEWENNYGGTSGDQATGIVVIDDGGYVVAGSSSSSNGDVTDNFGDADCWIIKLDQDGSLIWNLNIGGSGRDNARFAKQTTDGKYITVGFSESNDGNVGGNNGSFDYWVVKLGPPHFPTTALGNDTTVCQMDMVELSAFDPLCTTCTYLWNDGNTDPVRMVSPMQTTEYIVTLTDANGCTDSDTIMVSVNSLSVDLGVDVSACDLPELDAGPAEFYEWSTGETSQTIQPMQAGEYAVTVTDLLGCTAADTISLTGLTVGDASIDTVLCLADVFVFNGKMYEQSGIYADTLKSVGDCDSIITQIVLEISNLNLDIGADIEACDLPNNPVVLDAGIADFYSWSTGATSGTIQVNMPGTYACTVTDGLGCTQEDAVEVVEIPAFEITIDTAICAGESIVVGASTYSSTGNYTEQLTSVANCDSIVYLNLTVLPSLTQPAISGASEVCSGEAAIYQITNYDPAMTYGWDLPNDAILLNNSGGQAEIQFGSLSGEVTVSVSNSCEAVSSDVIMVVVGQATLPAPVFSGDTTVCEGETTIYQITSFDPASTYDWVLPTGAMIVAENGPNVSIQFAGNGGTLSLTEANKCGESTAYPVSINVGAPPASALPISGDVTICGNESATYSTGSVAGALTYQWTVSPGAFMQTTDSPTFDMDWAIPGMYSLCVVAENDCGISNQPQCLTVNVLELPQGQISGDTVLCGSGEVTLTFDLQGTGPWDITYSSGSAAYDVFGVTSSPHTIVQPVSMPTIFELIEVQNGNGCMGAASGTFEVSIEQQTAISIDTVLCSGEEILINGSVYADSGCYEVPLPALIGCDTVLTLCIDDAESFELWQVEQCEVPYIFNGKEIYNSGIYEDTILHSAACSTFVVLDLEILPSADFQPVPDTLSILNGTGPIDINLVENDTLPDSVPWSFSVLSQPNNGVVNDMGNGTVSLTVTNSSFSGSDLFNYVVCMDECPDTCKATTVSLIFIDDCIVEVIGEDVFPKAFSPNGDGVNDEFDPIQKFKDLRCPINEEETEMLILNRWGEVVFKPAKYEAWDGKRIRGSSKSFPPATYYYVLKLKKLDGEEVVIKGPISIFVK